MTVIAKESGHWYTSAGEPAYTYKNAKGETKNTTLRQARKEKLYPSVTTINKILAAPGLEIWKQNNILQAAATLPKIEGESVDDWCRRVVADAGEQGKVARDKGTAIHGAIERYYLGLDYDQAYSGEVAAVAKVLADLGITHVNTEKSFAHPLGYAGKIDFVGIDEAGRGVIVDFKTTDFKGKKKKHWPEMVLQLAAYAKGEFPQDEEEFPARLINVFVSRDLKTPDAEVHEWSEDEGARAWDRFKLILKLWQLEKNYSPIN